MMSATRNREQLVDDLLDVVTDWATHRPDVRAVGVAGSWARGEAGPDSDVDLVVLVDDPKSVLASEGQNTAQAFGVDGQMVIEDWGAVTAIRGYSREGLELEIGITTPAWASVDPLDAGTRKVIRGGFRIVYDPEGLLAAAVAAANDAR